MQLANAFASRAMARWRRRAKKIADTNGLILYEGPSQLTGGPIVAIAVGISNSSTNDKTGDMLQVYIMHRDISPMDAVTRGADRAVCGDCRHRPSTGGGCYVTVPWGPMAVWKTYKAGGYSKSLRSEEILRGAKMRFGAWGDPAAVPSWVWSPIRAVLKAHTSYTHFWHLLNLDEWDWCMASVDSFIEEIAAQLSGWRTYRSREPGAPVLGDTRICPAESVGLHCLTCGGCNGGAGVSGYWIPRHGTRRKMLGRQVTLFERPIETLIEVDPRSVLWPL